MHFKISALGEENTKKISSCLAATNSRKKTIEIKAERRIFLTKLRKSRET
jgi:hypothetical protein